MSPLHSLMFGWEYPPLHTGGLGVACKGLVEGLVEGGTKVTFVLPTKQTFNGALMQTVSPSPLETIIMIESTLEPYAGWQKNLCETDLTRECVTEDMYGPKLGEAVERFSALGVEVTKTVPADIVHCHDWMTYEAGYRAAALHRKPLIMHIHATELDRTHFHPNPWIMEQEIRGLMRANGIIAVSNYTKQILVTQYGIDASKISVVHNGTDTIHAKRRMDLGSRKKRPLVLFLGRLTIQKNPFGFLEVARKVHAMRPDVQFVIAGDGELLSNLMERSAELDLTECIAFLGKVNRRDAEILYRQADCFVMPSLSEPFGLVALEAASHGVPVILSRQSGVAEVLDHAFHVDFWDTDLMADCIMTILREEKLALQLRAEAPRVLSRLTWKNQAQKVVAQYRTMLSSFLPRT